MEGQRASRRRVPLLVKRDPRSTITKPITLMWDSTRDGRPGKGVLPQLRGFDCIRPGILPIVPKPAHLRRPAAGASLPLLGHGCYYRVVTLTATGVDNT